MIQHLASERGGTRVAFLAAVALGGLFLVSTAQGAAAAPAAQTGSIPVIYSTDLFHPHGDPDDHFDLAAIFAMKELDIRAIVLDQRIREKGESGKTPIAQMGRLTGRRVPAAAGLSGKLRSPTDKGLDQPPEFQGGVRLILDTLRASDRPVMIVAVGSMRDIAAAFNREPELLRAKVSRLLIFIGEASDPKFQEHNVQMDPQAYVGLMRSGLPIYWVPCFDGGSMKNLGHASFWRARHGDLLAKASPGMIQFFIYALEKEKADPLPFLAQPVDPARQAKLFAGVRNLWCTAIFAVLAGKAVAADGSEIAFVPGKPAGDPSAAKPLFGFSDVEIYITDDAVVRYGHRPDSTRVMRFEILDTANYAQGMTAATARLLAGAAAR